MGGWDEVKSDPWAEVTKPKSKMDTAIDKVNSFVDTNPVTRAVKQNFTEFGPQFKKGFINSASVGTIGSEENTMPGSVLTGEGKTYTPLEKLGRKTGQLTGAALPIMAAEVMAGATIPALIEKYGLDAVLALRAQQGLAGGLYGAAKAFVNRKPPLQGLQDTAAEAAGFMGLHYVGEKAEQLKNYLGKDTPESMGNYFAVQPRSIRAERNRKGMTSVGEDIINMPELGNTRKEVYDNSIKELNMLDNQINYRLGEHARVAKEPYTPDVPQDGTQLTYNPTKIQEINPPVHGSDAPIATPTTEKSYVEPFGNITKKTYSTIPEYVPEKDVNFSGTREEYTTDALGAPVRISKPTPDLVPPEKLGGFSTKKPISVETTQPQFGGFTKETPVGSQPEIEPVSAKSGLGKATRSLKEPERFPFTGIKKEPNISTGDVAKTLDEQIALMDSTGVVPEKVAKLKAIRSGFVSNKEPYLSVEQANGLRRTLDDFVGNDYRSQEVTETTEALQSLANNLRRAVGSIDPELAAAFAKQHRLIDIKNSLEPIIGNYAPLTDMTAWGNIVNATRTNLPLARGLREHLGPAKDGVTPIVEAVAPVAKKVAQAGYSSLSDAINEYRKKRRLAQQ